MSPHPIPDDLDEAATFHEGMRLFNDERDFFEAHEVWEDVWRAADGDRKRFYQGLIQCAVVIEHVRRGNPRGVRSVWESAQTKFVDLPEVYMGVNVKRLLADVGRFIDPVLNMGPVAFDPATGRGQDMPVDLSDAPTIDLAYDPFA